MGTINLVRIDDRLIHGQVMTKWSKGMGTNAIYVIDDVTAADDFMKDIYISTNSSANWPPSWKGFRKTATWPAWPPGT